ncbi:MAG: membrane dipeptidase [Acidobacteriota bacterium]
MGKTKHGTRYRSFDYLEPGVDYRHFDLAPELSLFPAAPVPLDPEQEERCTRLLDELVMISLHEHLGVFPREIGETPDMVKTGRMATAFEGLSASRWDCVFDNLMDGICTIESSAGWKWNDVLHDLGMRLCDIAHQDFVVPCLSVAEIHDAHEKGKLGWVASMEGAAMIENELDRIEILYGFGVRLLGIAYSEANALGSGLREPRDGGLTVFGRQAVERMNKVGMLIDCSHCGDQTTLDTIEWSEKPIVLSHIGARDLWDSNRLAPDAVLEACAAKGGVIGVEAAPHTTLSPQNTSHSIDSVMDHFEHIRALVGIDHVSFGPDAVYGDHVGLHQAYAASLSIKQSRAGRDDAPSKNPSHEPVEYVEGLENPTEGSTNLVRAMIARGYSDEEIEKAMGGNALRLLGQVWA